MAAALNAYRYREENHFEYRIYSFYKGDRVEDRDIIYEWQRSAQDGHWFLRVGDPGPEEFFSHIDLHKGFHRTKNPMGYIPRRRPQHGHFASTDISSLLSPLKPDEQKHILFCVDWCKRFANASERGEVKRTKADAARWATEQHALIVAAAEKLHEDEGRKRQTMETIPAAPKGGTLLDWVTRYERADYDPIVFYDNTGKGRREHFTAPELAIINEHVAIKASSDRTAVTELYEMLEAAFDRENDLIRKQNKELGAKVHKELRVPNIDTFRERCNQIPRGHLELAYLGKEAARNKNAAVRFGIDTDRPLERIELDESQVDLMTIMMLAGLWNKLTKAEKDVVSRVRLWITAAIDTATRNLLGLRFHPEEPSASTAVATLGMVFQDKSQLSETLGCVTRWKQRGNAEEVVIDSATWLASMAVRVAVLDAGACFFQPKAGDPRSKGTIERWFRTINRDALATFAGRTWGSPDEMGDLTASEQASIAYDQYAELMYRFLIDVYHNTAHYGLQGETPLAAWERLNKFYKPTPPMSQNIHRHIFGVKGTRKVTNAGIRFLGIQYWSKALHHLFLKKDIDVSIRVGISDLGMISVKHEQGWLNVPALHQEFAGMSVWKWMAFNKRLRILNQATAKVHRSVALRAKEYLRNQAEIARAEAQLGTAVVNDDDFKRWEKSLAHTVEIIDDEEEEVPVLHDESNLIDLYSDMHAGMLLAREEAKAQKRAAEHAKTSKRGNSDRSKRPSASVEAAPATDRSSSSLDPAPAIAPSTSSRFDR
ncbi:Mu transposase C-terminal domain-containing protein [Rhizobium laguerreae]|uniref:Mu transposase C-terminal domain-containing protein n=1 Tax=Rhizobium laguerreae TaxID=1076926 RepID=UPI001C916C36|nr:Mu transposase C-terminal domain-containing protein [Rhizobium laguerreae]MBY3483458.1 transposase [Rhizobium laguerreae]